MRVKRPAAFLHRDRTVIALLGLALLARLAIVAANRNYTLGPDPRDYDRIGRSIAAGRGYPPTAVAPGGGPTAFRPPLYPAFIAAVYRVAGPRPNAVRTAQSLLGVVTVGQVGFLSRRLWGRRVALTSMAIAGFFPPMLLTSSVLMPEALFVPLVLGALVAIFEHQRAPECRTWLLAAGVQTGLATLTRQNAASLLLPLAVAARTRPRRHTPPRFAVLTLLASFSMTVAPWTVRNAARLRAFVPVSTQDGYTLAGTYNDEARCDERYPGAWRVPWEPATNVLSVEQHLREAELSRRLRDHAIRYIRRHPLYPARVGFWNLWRTFHLDGLQIARTDASHVGASRGLADAGVFGFWLVAGIGLGGALSSAARETPLWFWGVPLTMLASTVFVLNGTRFRAPVDPFVVMLAALGSVAASRKLPGSEHTPLAGLRNWPRRSSSPAPAAWSCCYASRH